MELLTVGQMARADAITIAAGNSEFDLICAAAQAVAERCLQRFGDASGALVLCGPGNNGADGYVAARLLADAGLAVRVASLGASTGEAAQRARAHWGGDIEHGVDGLTDSTLVVDAMFGAGLSRELAGDAARWVELINQSNCPVLAIDVPSGVNGDDGSAAGPVVRADATVTFFRKKPGHLLYPGRALCGELSVAQIGIENDVLAEISPRQFENTPALWRSSWPGDHHLQHKYQRGHTLVFSGPIHATGAARLSAYAALRSGAGLVTLACPREAVAVVAAQLTAVMVAPWGGGDEFGELLADKRKNAVIIGPGFGLGAGTVERVEQVLRSAQCVVLDADALSAFENHSERFVGQLRAASGQVVLTPHEGEFSRLFDCRGSRLRRAEQASRTSDTTVVLKGPDTVIAAPDGRLAINANAPPSLATAGSGDVLAGIIGGLLAQGMAAFEAACCAVWMHAECANLFGAGLIAEDLADQLPRVIGRLSQADFSS